MWHVEFISSVKVFIVYVTNRQILTQNRQTKYNTGAASFSIYLFFSLDNGAAVSVYIRIAA